MAELKRHGKDYMAQQWHTCSYDHLALYRDLCLPCSTTVFCPYVSQVCREAVSQSIWRGMFMETRSWEQILWENEGRKCSGSCQEELGRLFKTVSIWNRRAGFCSQASSSKVHTESWVLQWGSSQTGGLQRAFIRQTTGSYGGRGRALQWRWKFHIQKMELSRAIFFHICTCREKECIFS